LDSILVSSIYSHKEKKEKIKNKYMLFINNNFFLYFRNAHLLNETNETKMKKVTEDIWGEDT